MGQPILAAAAFQAAFPERAPVSGSEWFFDPVVLAAGSAKAMTGSKNHLSRGPGWDRPSSLSGLSCLAREDRVEKPVARPGWDRPSPLSGLSCFAREDRVEKPVAKTWVGQTIAFKWSVVLRARRQTTKNDGLSYPISASQFPQMSFKFTGFHFAVVLHN